ncbi:RNA 2',3'-cyclic phosphodiesterase [Alicyclobacillus mengziensis]|uniref:RNA 2',3'-cyclic phosphodiesterase n=1 Tax=Alicyclobacillus mengziensis TaxID=2931921 RepID=A0A9X7W292_9BACL|nr:RNA 2',3'-cyclic phosphodiesterase [Alicyclobacillus mengziensis]QSO49147.1 RNA 2',3'-cyclic phosphodiesterase [Alicyclobacillus mengziensis]
MRLFFGVDVTSDIRSELAGVQSRLQEQGVKAGNWSRPELFHLTLLFIGETREEHLETLLAIGKETARQASTFSLNFGRLGVFERNRILWVGLQNDGGMEALRQVYDVITGLAAKQPFIKVDERPYSPHLTLARKLEAASISRVKEVMANESVSVPDPARAFPVSSICLFASKQVSGRLAYPIVERFYFEDVNAASMKL